jgi:hypothetical protein
LAQGIREVVGPRIVRELAEGLVAHQVQGWRSSSGIAEA